MIDINLIRTSKELLKEKLSLRREKINLDEISNLDTNKRKLQTEIDALRNKRKLLSNKIALNKKENKPIEIQLQQVEEIKLNLEKYEEELTQIDKKLNDLLLRIPNLPDDTVPTGLSQDDNIVVKQSNEIPNYNFDVVPHWEVGEYLDILDFKTASIISGARFVMLKNWASKLERALINFMLEEHIKSGYEEVWLPYLVTEQSITGTGQLPKFADELYKFNEENLYLIPTAEVSVMNIHRDQFIGEEELPKKYVSYSACFRRESGSYGKDTKGLIRNHQFNKIELVKIVKPENSNQELETLTEDASRILEKLGLTYRVVNLCSADLGFASAKTYDLEVWMPGEKRWREISSCSNCKDFQTRRLNIKIKYKDGKKELAHSLNGSGVAVGRTLACILETYQQKDGKIKIPEVLKPFIGKDEIP